ncbi:MAG: tRNA pseudouridine(55) synthase TruB [Bacteroidota bacterium]
MVSADDFLSGKVLLIDKPLEWTSFQAVNKIRWAIRKTFHLKKIKVGHAGTLDPLATGLLIICTGKKTKEISLYQGQEKTYTGTIRLGTTTPSYDLETDIDAEFDTDHITPDLIYKTTEHFIGLQEQYPPIFSAVKKDGKRLYEFARAKEAVEIKPRSIEISEFSITNIDGLDVHFKVRCSKGTYIRSLAHDFGKALKSGAHLTALRRTGIGAFKIEHAQTLDAFLASLDK